MKSTPRIASFQPSSYRQPKSPFAAFIWRRRMWFETTFAFSMLEPWEKILLLSIMGLLWVLVLTGLFQYLPHHILVMHQRAMYYLWGQQRDDHIFHRWLSPSVITPKEL